MVYGLAYEGDRTNGVLYRYLTDSTHWRKVGPHDNYNYKIVTDFAPTYSEGITQDIQTVLTNSEVILIEESDGYTVYGYIDNEGIHLVNSEVGARDANGYPTSITSITETGEVYTKQ